MKKLGLLTLVCFVSVVATAQSLRAFDVKASYGSETERFGIGAGMTLGVIGDLELSPSFNYYFEKDHTTLFDVDADFHYNFRVAKSLILYPLVGATYYNLRFEYDKTKEIQGKFGANVGGGIGIYLMKELLLKAEVKYQILDKPDEDVNKLLFDYKNQVKASVGLAYVF